VSVLAMPHPAALLQPLDAGRLDGAPTGEGHETLRVGALKLFADGGVTPAIDVHLDGSPMQFGELFEGLDTQVATAMERGFDVAIHAIGNAGLEAALDAYERAGGRASGRRCRVEHACLAGPDQMRRMAELGVGAVVQPGFLHHLGGQVGDIEFDDAAWLPFGDLAAAGVALAASSDDPCTFHEPIRTATHGSTRMTSTGSPLDPGQALGYDEWLRAYTAGAADVGGQSHERGRIVPGLRADLVVLDGELDPVHPPRVAQTWVGGRLVHDAAGRR
jgi:predicted amidohydrolase YtcJ